jgi:DNA-binding NtrC family response regulator
MSSGSVFFKEEEALYWSGKLGLAETACASKLTSGPTLDSLPAMLTRGTVAFDAGRVVDSIQIFASAVEASDLLRPELAFSSRLALFSRQSQFQAPDEAVALLSRVRQLAHASGDAKSIGALHLVVARLEALRGLCANARRHLSLSQRLLSDSTPPVRSSLHLLDAGLEVYAGNFERAHAAAVRGLEIASANQLIPILAGCLTNLGSVLLVTGKPDQANTVLSRAIAMCTELIVIRFSALDAAAQTKLFQGEPQACAELIERCDDAKREHSLPARSWYDLAHQTTRCSYHEHLGDWSEIVSIVDLADPELARRQYKGVRSSLLCAKARALSRMGRHADAQQVLALAVKTCPRSAVDPLIVLEATKALCAHLGGDTSEGAISCERALAASRAIGHAYHERWITALRDDMSRRTRVAVSERPRVGVGDAARLLADAATVIGAGHSVDLMAHRIVALLQATTMHARVSVEKEGNCEFQAEPSASWEATADGGYRIGLRGSDRHIGIQVRGVDTIEEVSLMKSLGDIVKAGIQRTSDTEREGDDQNLWPQAAIAADETAVFRSPRMIELLKIAKRLATTEMPVLISGETGTGKEIFARLVHDHSNNRRGPFIAFNCATIPRDLVDSQLFGHRRGAFTGAHDSFPGVIRSAEKGTLFLDEVGDLDIASQPKLLRFLENGEIQPVGEARPLQARVRIVAATNAHMDELVARGLFRRDLLYRIGATVLALPPLRERKDEIPALASFFFARAMSECGRSGLRLADDFVAALLLYEWPGNIRELANEIRRAVALAHDGDVLGAEQLAPAIARHWRERPAQVSVPEAGPSVHIALNQTLARAVTELEDRFIEHALATTGGRVTEAAQLLGLSRKGLFLKRRRRGLGGEQQTAKAADS